MENVMQRQKERREELYRLLGRLPDREHPVSCRLVETEEKEDYILERLVLEIQTDEQCDIFCEPIPALFVRPKGEGAFPTVLFSHSHGGIYEVGKEELLSPKYYMYRTPYAKALAGKGIASFCIDHWFFGERSGRKESATFTQMLWDGEVLWGRMVYDSLKAFDYLCTRPDVDSDRIAALGMSMGSSMSWWLAALEPRISVCVDICCLTDYDELIKEGGLDRHGVYYYVPGLRRHFSSAQINALIAPRPHLGTVGIYDGLTPMAGVEKIEQEVKEVYNKFDAEKNFSVLRYPSGHLESAVMRADILEFLDKHLMNER